jgi:histidine kinase
MAPSTYVLGELLYTNESARVHRGTRASDGLRVILKQARDAAFATRLKPRLTHELAALRALEAAEARHTLRPVELVDTTELCALVTHDAGGRALRDRPADERLPLRAVLEICRQLCMALGDAHAAGWVHCDVNPGNVVVTPDAGTVCLIDFGIAVDTRQPQRSQGGLAGTLAYLAPEQTGRQQHGVDPRTDLYSLGVMLYELLSGTRPHTAEDPQELLRQVLTEQPRPLHTLVALPRPLSDIVARLMHKEPSRRYQSAFGVERDLARCLEGGTEPPWEVGSEDRNATFRLSSHLHGRDSELAELLDLQRRAGEGTCKAAFLCGSAGVGKSALVGAVRAAAARSGAWFAEGKFEQLQRQIPFAGVSQAIHALVRRLLAEPEAELLLWRRRINDALGSTGAVLLPLIPDLQRLTGPLPAVRDLPSEQAEARLLWLLQKLLRALCDQRTLVLHIDDLQWADPGTCKLIERLATASEAQRLLLVSSYRVEEASGPEALVERVRAAGRSPTVLTLQPMGPQAVSGWLQELTGAAPKALRPLTELVLAKTQGNPFFIRHFLQELHDRALLTYDSRGGRWVWDVERIRGANVTDNVVELLAGKLHALPAVHQRLLGWSACYAGEFSAAMLADAFALDVSETSTALDRLAHHGIIVEVVTDTPEAEAHRRFAFSHDRLQAAAYALLGGAEAATAHLRVGRHLWARLGPQEAPFRTLAHLNQAHGLLTSDERRALVSLNLRGAVAAQQALAYETGYSYLKSAVALLGPDAWRDAPDLRHGVAAEALQIAVIAGYPQEARAHLEEGLAHAGRPAQRAELYHRYALSLQAGSRYAEATQAGLAALRILGLHIPERPHLGHVLTALLRLKAALVGRDIEALPDLPYSSEPRQRQILDVICDISHSTYFHDTNAFILMALHAPRLVLQHGKVPASGFFYAIVGTVFFALNDAESGKKWMHAARRFSDAMDPPHPATGRIQSIQGMMLDYASLSPHDLVNLYREASRLSMEHGDLNYATISPVLGAFMAAHWSLDEMGHLVDAHRDICKRSVESALQLQCVEQYGKMVRGETRAPDSFGDDICDAAELERAARACNTAAQLTLWSHLVFGCWSNGRIDAVLAAARNLDAIGFFLNSGEQTPSLVSVFIVLACVESAWRHPRHKMPDRRLFKKAYTWLRRRLGGPGGRLHGLWLLAQAEVAALERGQAPAGALGGAATSLAASGYHALAGEAFERWARDRLRQGDDTGAALPLMLASRSFEAWGAPYRVRRLRDELVTPLMARLGGLQDVLSGLMSATASTSAHPVTQTQATDRGDLLPRLTPGVTHALGGATSLDVKVRAVLDELLRLTSATRSAYMTWEASTGRLAPAGDTATGEALPMELLGYVTRTREALLVDDASQPTPLPLTLPPVASLLAMPVHTYGQLLGVLYVENDTVPRTLGRAVADCEVLAVQLAMSHEIHALRTDVDTRVRAGIEASARTHARAIEEARARTSVAMAGGFAHEIRNALAPAAYALDALQMGLELPQEALDAMGDAKGGIERALKVAASTLAYARASDIMPGAETTPIPTLVNNVLADLRPRLERDHIVVRVDVDAQLEAVIKPDHITTVLRHLLENACDAVGGSGASEPSIWVRGVLEAQGVALTVRDNGRGLAAAQREQLFQPFFSTKGAAGLGLGLGLSQRIMGAYGGRIDAASPGEGQGASFTVIIPPLGAEAKAR